MKYYRHKIENLLVINKIVTIHYFEFGKNFSTKGERHDFWELVYADKGDIICSSDGKYFTLKEGEIYFHKPNEFHTLSTDGKTAPNVFIISFECRSEAMAYFNDLKVKMEEKNKYMVYSIFDDAKNTFDIPYSDPKLKKLKIKNTPLLGGEQTLKNTLEILLISILRNQAKKSEKLFLREGEIKNRLTKDITVFLKENVYNSVNMDDIVKKVNYSKAYCFREFKKIIGKSIMEYYTELKIEEGKKLLRENELSVSEISVKLAFDTPNYFSKTFKKCVGLTPTEYKKRSANL